MNFKRILHYFLCVSVLALSANSVQCSKAESSYSLANLWKPAALLCTGIAMAGYLYFKSNELKREKVKKILNASPHVPIKDFKKERDHDDCSRIHNEFFFGECTHNDVDYFRVLRVNHRVLGFIKYKKNGIIESLAVDSVYQRIGIGSRLLTSAQTHLTRLGQKAMILGSVPEATGFYRKHKFYGTGGYDIEYMRKDIA